MKLLKHKKLGKIIFKQLERSICTRNYSYHFKQHKTYIYVLSASMDPASMTKQSDLNPPEKSKIFIKYRHIFLNPSHPKSSKSPNFMVQ